MTSVNRTATHARRVARAAMHAVACSSRRGYIPAPSLPPLPHAQAPLGAPRASLRPPTLHFADMTIQSDRWITRMAREHGMIEPFETRQVREGVISYGVSSYGYDMRVAREFRIFTNVLNSIVDPKNFDRN